MTDNGAGVDAAAAAMNGEGHGLAGLAERVNQLHGRLEAGAAPGGGFRLAVTLPTASS
jgi:signal transduction histidine kinase